jgi:vitamin B12 transporter
MQMSIARADDAEEVTIRGSQAGGFSSRAKLEDAPREITNAASLVEPLPGVHVRRLGADDGFSTMSVRGSSSTQVAVYLAGVPLTGGADPSLDLSTLPLWPGARARVYRSFAPAALGPGSLGGTLMLEPPAVTGPNRTEVWAAVGSFGARRLRVGDVRAVGDDGTRVATALSVSRSSDDFSYDDKDGEHTRENAQHAAASGLVAWTRPIRFYDGTTGTLTVTTLAQARRQHVPGALTHLTPNQVLATDRELAAVELAIPSELGAWRTRAWGRHDGTRVTDVPRGDAAFDPSRTSDAIAAAGASAGWRGRPVKDVTLDARVDGSGERFMPGEWIGAPAPPGATRVTTGLASDVEWRAAEKLTTTASGRVDLWNDEGGTSKQAVRPAGHIGGELMLGPVALASHGGVLTRPPSFVERFGNHGIFVGNPLLKPESAWTFDVGARAQKRVGDVSLRAEVAGFVTWATDLIVFVPQGIGVARTENVGQARIAGAEALLEGRGFGFEVRASYTGLATENEDQCTGATGACQRPPLPGRPAHDAVFDLSYGLGPLRVRYGLDVVAGITTDLAGGVEVPARALHSTGARLDVPGVQGLRLAIDVRNLFDLRTVAYPALLGTDRRPIGDLYDYPLPGRSVLVSALFQSGR